MASKPPIVAMRHPLLFNLNHVYCIILLSKLTRVCVLAVVHTINFGAWFRGTALKRFLKTDRVDISTEPHTVPGAGEWELNSSVGPLRRYLTPHTLHYTILHCTTSHYITPRSTAIYTIPHRIAPYHTTTTPHTHCILVLVLELLLQLLLHTGITAVIVSVYCCRYLLILLFLISTAATY